MFKKFFAALAVMIFIFSATPTKTFAGEHTGEVIEVAGIGMKPIGAKSNGSFYRSFARQVAKLDAMRNLAEQVQPVKIKVQEGLTVSDKITTDLSLNEKFWNEYFSKVEVVGVKFKSDGSCEVTMQGIPK